MPNIFPPAFKPGYPTAAQISNTYVTLAADLYTFATVYYVIMLSSQVPHSL